MNFRYQAFISYSSKDADVVKWLHRKLETYRLPRSLVGRPGRDGPVTKTLFPIFRDRDELPLAADLGATIEDALRCSRYLIVVCSKNAAQSRWVNEEIRYFKSLGRDDRIFAIMLDGVPNGSDNPTTANEECFPIALRHQLAPDGAPTGPRVEPICGDLRPGGDGKRVSFLKAVAGIVGIGYNALAQREIKRRRRRQAALGIVVFAAMLAGLYTWDFNRTKVGYYAMLTSRWGIPEGVTKLDEQTVRQRKVSYRIESSRRKVRRITLVNGSGRLRDDSDNFGAAIQEMHYRENGDIEAITLNDHNNLLVLKKVFNERKHDATFQTIEFKRAFHDQPFTLGTGLNRASTTSHKTAITAYQIEYTPEGLAGRTMYLDAYRNPKADESGVGGKHSKYNSLGLPEEIQNLDCNGQLLPNQIGVVTTKFQYDAQGNVTNLDYHNLKGDLTIGDDGTAQHASKFDAHGNIVEMACFGTDGHPIVNKDGYAKTIFTFDERGNVLEEAYFDVHNQPILRKAVNYAKLIHKYDEWGNVIEETYLGTQNQPILRDVGIAKLTEKYDERGNVTETAYFGIDGQPILSKEGYARWTLKYDERGNEIEYAFFGIGGQPTLNAEGVCKWTGTYDERGNKVEYALFGTNGQPILSKSGYAKGTIKYDERGNKSEIAYFGIDSVPTLSKDGYAKAIIKYDDHGNAIESSYFGANGQPILSQNGFAKCMTKYDERGGGRRRNLLWNWWPADS